MVTETTSTGQPVIVIQPANPQVVYVPVYNTQTVYVQAAPPPSSASVAGAAVVGFTAGVIIGAASDHYYHGPYGWHGAAMYNEAWDRREDYWDERQDLAEDRYDNRRTTRRIGNRTRRRTSAAPVERAVEPDTTSVDEPQANQGQRQSTAQSTQATRQASAATSSAGSGQAAAARSSGGGGLSGTRAAGVPGPRAPGGVPVDPRVGAVAVEAVGGRRTRCTVPREPVAADDPWEHPHETF